MFNFNAPISNITSYGLVALNIAKHLDCNIIPIGQPSFGLPQSITNKFIGSKPYDLSLPTVRLFHQFDLMMVGKNKRIGYTIFELDTFNNIEKAHLSSVDEIWVCTEWAKGVVKNNGITTPVKVVPLGVDRDIFHEVEHTPNVHIFFSAGKWEIRKSQDEIVEAFNLAFKPTDNVELWMSMNNIFHDTEFMGRIRYKYMNTPMGKAKKIKFVGPFKTQQDLARIMNTVSCGVFPSKAEGWGLETLEMMACGKEVIVTDYAGHTEFCNGHNSTLIPVTSLTPAFDDKWFFGQGNWGVFDINHLVEALRASYKNGYKVNITGIQISKMFSWENTARIFKELLS
ncbi:MAG TPA: glycosyltransferase [Chitinophagaceae bacterium]|nr:glycosyltransferase [Chitinophagaceae bacterium]